MNTLHVTLFGQFQVRLGKQVVTDLYSRKAQELFCYLLLNRDRSHPRETLASLLWGDSSTSQSKRYLRQTLWQLQTALKSRSEPSRPGVLLVDPNWIRLNPAAGLRLDVAAFEQAFARTWSVPGQVLDALQVQALHDAVALYQGDLLEDWFQDWCLYERERLQNIYLTTLDKLMDYCEASRDYDAGLAYGTRILRYDLARERTHRRLMRLYYLAGYRTSALRQYDRCVQILRRELGVKPAASTVALYEQIRKGRTVSSAASPSDRHPHITNRPLVEILPHLKQLQTLLAQLEDELEHVIHAAGPIMKDQHSWPDDRAALAGQFPLEQTP